MSVQQQTRAAAAWLQANPDYNTMPLDIDFDRGVIATRIDRQNSLAAKNQTLALTAGKEGGWGARMECTRANGTPLAIAVEIKGADLAAVLKLARKAGDAQHSIAERNGARDMATPQIQAGAKRERATGAER